MAIVHQVLSAPDIDDVFDYANRRLALSETNEQERMFQSWSVRWRREALEHYLKLGWSFIARDNEKKTDSGKDEVVGFFLGQPFLFFRGQTQTLWVEHVEADTEAISKELVEIAVKVGREKHIQRVIFGEANALELTQWKPEPLEHDIAVVKTTKG